MKTDKKKQTRKNKRRNSGGTLKERLSSLFTNKKYKTEPEILEIIPDPIINRKSDSIESKKKYSSQNSVSQLKTIYERMDTIETRMNSLEKNVDSLDNYIKHRFKGIEESFDIVSRFMDNILDNPGMQHYFKNNSM